MIEANHMIFYIVSTLNVVQVMMPKQNQQDTVL